MTYPQCQATAGYFTLSIYSVTTSPGVGIITLHYPVIYPLSTGRRYDRRLPMHDKVLYGALHELLMVQRKRRPRSSRSSSSFRVTNRRRSVLSTLAASFGTAPAGTAVDGSGQLSCRCRHPGTFKITSSSRSLSALRGTFDALTTVKIARVS